MWEGLISNRYLPDIWWGPARRDGLEDRLGPDLSGADVDFTGEVLEADPPRKLVFTFLNNGTLYPRMHAEGALRVTYLIEPIGENVRLTLAHDQFPEDSVARPGVAQGWVKIIRALKTLLETGSPLDLTIQGGAD